MQNPHTLDAVGRKNRITSLECEARNTFESRGRCWVVRQKRLLDRRLVAGRRRRERTCKTSAAAGEIGRVVCTVNDYNPHYRLIGAGISTIECSGRQRMRVLRDVVARGCRRRRKNRIAQ